MNVIGITRSRKSASSMDQKYLIDSKVSSEGERHNFLICAAAHP